MPNLIVLDATLERYKNGSDSNGVQTLVHSYANSRFSTLIISHPRFTRTLITKAEFSSCDIILNCLCQCRYCSVNNMNKLSLVGLQLPEKYKDNFDVSSEGPWSGVTSYYSH
jgi:hypothetical protein